MRDFSRTAAACWLVALSFPGPAQGDAQKSIRVATIKLFHDFPKHSYITERLDIVADEIRAQRIDVLGVQEVSPLFRQHWVLDLRSRSGKYV